MSDDDLTEPRDLAAGDFATWMGGMAEAIRGARASDVPCGGCTACCTSSQFIHIGPDETDTLAHIPADLVFPAPQLPRGHMLLGYDERGHCPMLVDGQCSIYAHRPRTCRTYDCRIFAAAGLAGDDGRPVIARQVARWRFAFASPDDQARRDAVQAAARFLREHPDVLPAGTVAANATQLAVLALQVHEVFLQRDAVSGRASVVAPEREVVRAEAARRTGFRRTT